MCVQMVGLGLCLTQTLVDGRIRDGPVPVALHWWYEMHGAVAVRRCVMVPTRLSVSHWPARSSSSRLSTVVGSASFGDGVFLGFCIFQRCVGFQLGQCRCLVTLGRDIGHFPHDPLKLRRLLGLLLVVEGDFLAEFSWIRHCSGSALRRSVVPNLLLFLFANCTICVCDAAVASKPLPRKIGRYLDTSGTQILL